MESQEAVNQFLREVGRRLRRGRTRFEAPVSSVRRLSANLGEIWVPSRGCRFDFAGYCTMCNYGVPDKVSHAQMIEAVRVGLEQLAPIPSVLWVSAFNMLDPTEVPLDVLRRVLLLIAETDCEILVIESHPQTVSL